MQVILDHLAEAQESVAREALLSQIFLRSERGLSLAIEHVDTALNNVGSNSRTSRELAANFGRSASAMSDAARRMSDGFPHRDVEVIGFGSPKVGDARMVAQSNINRAIHITHEQIANELGSARVVVSRLLKQLEEDGVITLGRNKIFLV